MPKPAQIPSELEPFHDKLLDGLHFCRLAYDRLDELLALPDQRHTLRERRGPVKKLLEELLPICRYIQTFYGPGQYLAVRWIYGSQSLDAKIESSGAAVDHGMWPARSTLEITQAVHENEYLMRELLNSKGGGFGLDGITKGAGKRGAREIFSEPMAYSNQSYIGEMAEIVLKSIGSKVAKAAQGKYPDDTTLIVDCSLTTIFLRSEWEALLETVRSRLPVHSFVQIFLTAASGKYSATL